MAATAADAAVFTPGKEADTLDGACDHDCSLREAVVAANANPGMDVIVLGPGNYVLSHGGAPDDLAATGDLDVTNDLVILGAGAVSTSIRGGLGLDRIFEVWGASLDLSGVALRDGSAVGSGGAIRNDGGTLTLSRVLLADNSSGSGFGGAIRSEGEGAVLNVTASTFLSNLAQGSGGAIAASGEMTLANVTFVGNRAVSGFGGALYLFADLRATINNATLAANTAAREGGGVFAESSAFIGRDAPRFSNSILAGNRGTPNQDCSGTVLSGGHNLVGDGAGCTAFTPAKGDLEGTFAQPLDAKLVIPASDFAFAVSLAAGSPALDAGSPAAPGSGNGACEATDQRGAVRPAGARCDIGSFEAASACVADATTLCLNNGRFRVKASWRTSDRNGAAGAVGLTDDSGYLFFFDPTNVEVTIKVLNGCANNNRYWVFVSGLTNVRVDLTVTDTDTGQTKTYVNPQGTTFQPKLDTNAFATCP
jgi:CSLREA domain-containing protein